ncbi:GlxA family transcriptional regulator [Pseudomonas aeruginosa]|uniref:GlxA family transcriptional regulator n=1 Tax=Pseudomonas aeruginosa TaxID=287 RepID=UPI0009A33353|nr:GlxA family transcriptional regulator [Pseudomonas aeruginosa]
MSDFETIEIGIVAYQNSQESAVLGLTDLLRVAGRIAASHTNSGIAPFRLTHWKMSSPFSLPGRVFDTAPSSDVALAAVILPPTLEPPIESSAAQPWSHWLRECHADGAILGSVCAGAFLLAESGLLSKRKATTHWAYAEQFQQRFPDVYLDTDQLVIDDGDIITAGGAMAWTDMGLRLIDRFLGPSVMIETAQMLLIDPPGREQRYYSVFSPRLTHGDGAILRVQHWLQATAAKDISLSDLAARARLGERTFLRRFQKATGMTTMEYCQRLRIGNARRLLQFSVMPIERVAWDVGYSDPKAFRKVFQRIVGLSPGDYRSRFSPLR